MHPSICLWLHISLFLHSWKTPPWYYYSMSTDNLTSPLVISSLNRGEGNSVHDQQWLYALTGWSGRDWQGMQDKGTKEEEEKVKAVWWGLSVVEVLHKDWLTLPPSACSSPAPSFAAGQVADGRPTFCWLQPFPCLTPVSPPTALPLLPFFSCRHCSFPTGPRDRSISRCSGAITLPALLPHLLLLLDITWFRARRGRSQALEMCEQRSISIFYRCDLPLELCEERARVSFWFLEDSWKEQRVCEECTHARHAFMCVSVSVLQCVLEKN